MKSMASLFNAALVATSIHANAQPQAPVDAPEPVLVVQCEKLPEWTGVPADDPSSMAALGKRMCTNQPFSATLADPNGARPRTFAQLSLAYDHLSQQAALGRSIESGILKNGQVNLPNIYVTRKPNLGDGKTLVYCFEMIVRRSRDESGPSLQDEAVNPDGSRSGRLTGLFEIAPSGKAAKSSLGL